MAAAKDLNVTRVLALPKGSPLVIHRSVENPLERNNCVEAYFEVANLAELSPDAARRSKMVLELIENVLEGRLGNYNNCCFEGCCCLVVYRFCLLELEAAFFSQCTSLALRTRGVSGH